MLATHSCTCVPVWSSSIGCTVHSPPSIRTCFGAVYNLLSKYVILIQYKSMYKIVFIQHLIYVVYFDSFYNNDYRATI